MGWSQGLQVNDQWYDQQSMNQFSFPSFILGLPLLALTTDQSPEYANIGWDLDDPSVRRVYHLILNLQVYCNDESLHAFFSKLCRHTHHHHHHHQHHDHRRHHHYWYHKQIVVHRLAVSPEYRSLGIAKALMGQAGWKIYTVIYVLRLLSIYFIHLF